MFKREKEIAEYLFCYIIIAAIIVVTIICTYKGIKNAKADEFDEYYTICECSKITDYSREKTSLLVTLPDGNLHIYTIDYTPYEISEVCLLVNSEIPVTWEVVATK